MEKSEFYIMCSKCNLILLAKIYFDDRKTLPLSCNNCKSKSYVFNDVPQFKKKCLNALKFKMDMLTYYIIKGDIQTILTEISKIIIFIERAKYQFNNIEIKFLQCYPEFKQLADNYRIMFHTLSSQI